MSGVGRFVARHRGSPLFRGLASASRRFLDWHANLDYDLSTNGEAFVLGVVAGFEPRLLVDVGANVGEWTLLARRSCPEATIHAFEIAAPTFERLKATTRHLEGVHCHAVGLSDAPGATQLRHFPDAPALTTSSEYPHPLPFTELGGRLTTGDAFAAAHGLEHIDLLKIDVEGMEAQVLRGFDGMLRERRIDVVQFEYGRVSILNHFLLRDFYAFFDERGYVVGKIFPAQVDFREYALGDEDFRGPNYLAVREDLAGHLEALAASREARSSPAPNPSRVRPAPGEGRIPWRETWARVRRDHARVAEHSRALDGGSRMIVAHPSFLCALLHRLSHHFFRAGHPWLARLFWQANSFFLGADISPASDIGPGLLVVSPAGTALSARAGRNLTLMPLAGIGGEVGRWEDVGAGPGLPVLGDDVRMEPFSGVLGPVKVGHRVCIEAGTVVVRDVADDATVMGPPPRILRRPECA